MKQNTKLTLGVIALITLISMSCMLFQASGGEPDTEEAPIEPVQEESEDVRDEEADVPEETAGELLGQWALSATASSEYDNPDWAATQATGQPDASDECGDFRAAWASAESTGVDWLELLYEKPVYPEQINIYQNNLPNQVVEVEVLDTLGNYHTVYTGQPEVTNCPYILTVDITDADYLVTGVRMTVDQSILDPTSWDEIDAVELVGRYVGDEVADMPPANSPSTEASTNEQIPTGDFELPELAPSSLGPGSFSYEIVGADEDISIESNTLQYQSTSDEYVIGLISEDTRYSLSLILPMDLSAGPLPLIPYESGSFNKSPTTAIYIGFHLFVADSGLIMLEDVNDAITGSFAFVAHDKDDPSQVVTISGAFNQISLEE